MRDLVNIVWAAGSEGYHITAALRDFPERAVIAAVTDRMQATGLATTYADATRRALEVVDYFRHISNGATVCRQAHQQLQRDAESRKGARRA